MTSMQSGRYARVVAALAHVDMIIGVNWLLGAEFSAKELNGTVRDDLIDGG